jgi:Ca-activated chloride channel family protein
MYSEQPKNIGGVIIVTLAVLIFGGIIAGRYILEDNLPKGGNNPMAGGQTGVTSRDSNTSSEKNSATSGDLSGAVEVIMLTSDTKAEWLNTVTDPFNAARHKTSSGMPIVVSVVGHGSPGKSQQRIINGELRPTIWSPGDISWVETANQVVKDRGARPLVTEECPRLVYAATGFAMWRPMAEALGWPDQPIGWDDIVTLAADPQGWASYGHPEWGQFKFGHAHPEHSTTGFSVMATLAYATLNLTSDLTPEKVKSPAVVDAFRTVELNTYHYGTSTRSIMVLMANRGPSYLHAATSSETSVLATNHYQRDVMRFPFVFIFPADGTFWSDNPACIMDGEWVTDDHREAAQIYRDYLLEPEQQDVAVTIGLRPSNPSVVLHDPISLAFGTDPRVSPQIIPPLEGVSGTTAEAIIDIFKQTKKKSTIVVLLDTSGSMKGEKLKNAIEGTTLFLNQLDVEDEIIIYQFNDTVQELQPSGRVGDVVERLNETLANLFTEGNTTLYDSVCQAVEKESALREAAQKAGEKRLYGIVVLSDGRDTNSEKTDNDMFNCLPSGEDVDGVKIFTIAYGDDADEDLLLRVANRTNGKFFDGDPENIDFIYLAISSEQ